MIKIELNDFLHELIALGKMSPGDAERIEMDLRAKKILEKHQYDIFRGSDGRWNTHVFDATKPNRRRRVKKTKKEDLYKYLEDYYGRQCEFGNPSKITLRELYPLWMEHKLKLTSDVNCDRIASTWKLYYEQSEIVNYPISKLNKLVLEEWIIPTVKGMKVKEYEKFEVIIKQMLEYAEDKNIIDRTPYRPLTKEQRMQCLVKPPKKKSEDMVFSGEDLDKLMDMARHDLIDRVKDFELAPLVVMFMFATAMRISEAIVIKEEDIEGDILSVNRMFRRDSNTVIDHVKMNKIGRSVTLSPFAQECIKYAKGRAEELGVNPEYIFCVDGTPKSYYRSVSEAFKKYSEKIGSRKMTHTARRQCISALRNSHIISVEAIRDFAGHEDISTTDSYTYDTSGKAETNERIRKVVDSAIFHGMSPLSPRK